MNLYLQYIYIYIVPPLGAFKSQLGGTYILSLLFYTVNVYCDYTSIYIYIFIVTFHSSCLFIVDGFARPMHSTTEIRNDVSEQVCHSCCVRQVGRNSSGKAFLG